MKTRIKKSAFVVTLLMIILVMVPSDVYGARLSRKTVNINSGKTVTITLLGTKVAKVTTSKKSVASVKRISSTKVRITAGSEGKATIRVTGKNKKVYKCTVVVKPRLSRTSVTLYKGKSTTISVVGAKIKSISKSNSTIVSTSKTSTSKIKIIAKRAGKSTVTVTTKGGKRLKCTVTVKNPPKPPTPVINLKINKQSGVLLKDESYRLIVTGATEKIKWAASKNSVANVDSNGKVTAITPGSCTITATANGKTVSCKINVVDFEIEPREFTMNPGEIKDLQIKKYGTNIPAYTLQTTNSMIATVTQSGRVYSVPAIGGEANIQLKCATLNGTATVFCGVKVIPITSIFSFYRTLNNSYTIASGNVSQKFSDGMNADIRLVANDFDKCDEKRFDHCNGMATIKDGNSNYYFVADTWNNRVLVYKIGADETWSQESPIYCVLGQKTTTSTKAGYGLDEMNWPVGVAVGRGDNDIINVFVTDSTNNRILVWEEIPSENGSVANYSIRYMTDPSDNSSFGDNISRTDGFINRNEARISWPWAIWTDGSKLICTSTANGYILVWNELPTESDLYPDNIIYCNGTPRTIITDGKYLVVGDHNVDIGNGIVAAARVYNNLDSVFESGKKVAVNEGDLIYRDSNTLQPGGLILSKDIITEKGNTLPKGTLLLCAGGYVGVWKDGKLDSPNDAPDYYIGGGTIDNEALYYFNGGDYNQIIQDEQGNIFVVCYNGCKIVGYSTGSFPDEPESINDTIISGQNGDEFIYNGQYYWVNRSTGIVEKHCTQNPDICIGADSPDENVEKELCHYQNCAIDSDGRYLIATDDLHSNLLIWNGIPDESGAKPDAIYKFNATESLNDGALIHINGQTGIVVGGRTNLMVWSNINDALSGAAPDKYFRMQIGNTVLSEIQSVDFDGKYLYVAMQDGIYMWNGIPNAYSSPIASIKGRTGHISVTVTGDKTYVTLANNGECAYIYDRTDILAGKTLAESEMVVRGALYYGVFRGFNGASDMQISEDGKVFLCDMGFNRILIWDSVQAAVNGDDVINTIGLGANNYTIKDDTYNLDAGNMSIQSQNTFYAPHYIDYDGNYLWVGDFKFSGGIKRFSGTFN